MSEAAGSARFRRIEALFLAASDLPEAERSGFLAAKCGDDTALREEVEAMLEHRQDSVLEGPNEFRGGLQGVLDDAGDAGPQVGVPEKIGKYAVLRRIGLGGMGAVYEAEQQHPHRRVALKVVRPDALLREMLSRFRHETELLGRLQPPTTAPCSRPAPRTKSTSSTAAPETCWYGIASSRPCATWVRLSSAESRA